MSNGVRFVRIRGRIVPIRTKGQAQQEKPYLKPSNKKALAAGVGGAATFGALAGATTGAEKLGNRFTSHAITLGKGGDIPLGRKFASAGRGLRYAASKVNGRPALFGIGAMLGGAVLGVGLVSGKRKARR